MNKLWKISKKLYSLHLTILARLFELLSYTIYSTHIPAKTIIGEGTEFMHHGLGTVVHEDTVIGKNCVIFQNVTIGAKWSRYNKQDGVPKIGDNVQIGAGAVILGRITISDNVCIGANAVVLKDVPSNTLVVGVPAEVKI